MSTWILPENIADILPSEARKIEESRRALLDLFHRHGYELVMPPMLEYLESLLAGAGEDTRLNTFKLTDQASGRAMGVRSDTTIQTARIDAHLLNRASVTRLCYAGPVLHARPSGLHPSRELYQIGAELYGCAGLEADIEILDLALAALARSGVKQLRLDLCHAGLIRSIIDADTAARADWPALVELLRAKDAPGLSERASRYAPPVAKALLALIDLYGDASVLDEAERRLGSFKGVSDALRGLRELAQSVSGQEVSIDLADLRGYAYETGVTFSVYVPGLPNAIIRGGRYDDVGEAFGRRRPAIGFSMDLRELARLLPPAQPKKAILARWTRDVQALAMIAQLREQGEVVVQAMPGHEHEQDEFDCDREIVCDNNQWIIRKVS